MPDLTVENLKHAYGNSVSLHDVSFTVHDGELLTLLGPSGCGKTTTLMSLAGLTSPRDGRIICGAEVLFDQAEGIDVAPERRGFGMVFQSYAIWPHLTVEQNVRFPLRLRRVNAAEAGRRVEESLELVSMAGYARRYPHELSGGQQQRVALARALVYHPRMLLLDEPLSNLDAKLREEARSWLKELQAKVGLTTVLVTHDQDEALALSDRVVLLRDGQIEQVGTPRAIYEHPTTEFAATFLGTSNLLRGRLQYGHDGPVVTIPAADGSRGLAISISGNQVDRSMCDEQVTIALRPEAILLRSAGSGAPAMSHPCHVISTAYLGSRTKYVVDCSGHELSVMSDSVTLDGPLEVEIPANACRLV